MLIALLVACEEPPPPPPPAISDVMRPVLVVNSYAEPGKPERVQVFLHPEQEGPKLCIPKMDATVNGTPLPRLTGEVKEEDLSYDRDCKVYEFAGDVAGTGDAEVAVTDGIVTVRASIPGLFAARGLTLETPMPVKAGSEVALRWNTPGDRWDPKADYAIELRPVASPEEREVVKATAAEGVVRFVVPDHVPAGEYDATFMGTAHVQPQVTTCERAVKCDTSRKYVVPPVRVGVR